MRNLPLTFDYTVHTVKSKGKISQNFVAFSEYMNFMKHLLKLVPFHNALISVELIVLSMDSGT